MRFSYRRGLVVNYGCAANGLSGAGGNATKMTEFPEAALNPADDPTPQGRLSIADAVTAIYGEGRNKLAHGEAPGLLEAVAKPRAIGGALLRSLFRTAHFESGCSNGANVWAHWLAIRPLPQVRSARPACSQR